MANETGKMGNAVTAAAANGSAVTAIANGTAAATTLEAATATTGAVAVVSQSGKDATVAILKETTRYTVIGLTES